MKTTLKVALLASVLMATPVLAGDKADNSPSDKGRNAATEKAVKLDENGNPIHRKHYRRSSNDGAYYNRQSPAASLDDADRMNGSNSRYGYADTSNSRWLGMSATTRGMKDGVDSDMNNRSQHAFIFGNNGNRVVKH